MFRTRKILPAGCAAVLALSALAGCSSGSKAEASGTDLKEKLKALTATEKELGLEDRYASAADIQDGSLDPELIGTWKTAKGDLTYYFLEDGTAYAESADYGSSEPLPYTCITLDDRKIICEEMSGISYGEDGSEEEFFQMSYFAYQIENDALYLVAVDSPQEYTNSSANTVIALYKDGSETKPAVSVKSLYGKWTGDYGTIVIDENGLTVKDGPDDVNGTYAVSVNEQGDLVVEKDGRSTVYPFALAYCRDYSDTLEVTGTEYALALYYIGTDENDRPNLAGVMSDWHAEYDYDEFRFDFSARSPAE
ncbi:MAG: hypothetical protein K6G61_04085 [Solobacterium sp.]|nr:hypothetical protein [Solobacterium sp.]